MAHGISHVYTVLILVLQDTVVIVSPCPFNLQDPSGVPLGKSWYASPQLFFTCHVLLTDGRPPSRTNCTNGPNDILLELVFLSNFEPLDLPKDCPIENAGVQKLHEPSLTPIGRVPLFPQFLNGNTSATILCNCRHHQCAKIPTLQHRILQRTNATGGKGSYAEVNLRLWQFGRGKPRLERVSIAGPSD